MIETCGNSDENIYISTLELNGKPMDSIQLPWSEFTKGGVLKIGMSDQPSETLTK